MVGFGLDYACAHIIILAEISSENLLPIRADFVTERVNATSGAASLFILYHMAPVAVVVLISFSPTQLQSHTQIVFAPRVCTLVLFITEGGALLDKQRNLGGCLRSSYLSWQEGMVTKVIQRVLHCTKICTQRNICSCKK